MDGFTRSILAILLGWMRSFVNNLWLLLGSEGGGAFISFMRTHWKTIFLVACVGGFVVDRVIYLIRWRPYYVWGTKLGRLKRGRRSSEADEVRADAPAYSKPLSKAYAKKPASYSPPQAATLQETLAYGAPILNDPYSQNDVNGHTVGYAPLVSARNFAPEATISYPYMSSDADLTMEPVFDEDSVAWTTPLHEQTHGLHSSLYAENPIEFTEPQQEPFEHPAMNMAPVFGMAKSEPAQYLMDVQDGFAPPPEPEALYPGPIKAAVSEPIHPGLDLETFQQNFGLAPSESESESNRRAEPLLKPAVDFPNTTFVPFYQNGEQNTTQRSRRALSDLAKKARSLVSINDEDNPPTIRDLQPTMDIKDAFHAPVFPRKPDEGGGES